MLRQCLQTIQTRRLPWRGPAMFCFGLILVSAWLSAGCEPPAERTSPTPTPATETPAPTSAATRDAPATPHESEGEAVPAPPQASHSPPVQVPPRPTLTPIPAARLDELFRNPEIRPAATWEDRKRQVAENPALVWHPGFIVPPGADHHHPPSLGELWDYTTVADAVTFTDSQNKRMYAIRDEISRKQTAGTLSEAEYKRLDRRRDEISVEGLDSLTAAKYLLRHQPFNQMEITLAYAERAVRKHRKSPEARHVLSLVYERLGRKAEAIAALRQMLALAPTSSIALRELAWHLRQTRPQEALGYIQTAIQLDARIPKYNVLLAECYAYLGQYDKALEVYQNMTSVDVWTEMHITAIQEGTPMIHQVGTAKE